MIAILIGLGVVWWLWWRVRVEQIASFRLDQGTVHAMCLMSSDDVLLTGENGETIEFRSLPDGKLLRRLRGHSS